jgi:hypothetical protein
MRRFVCYQPDPPAEDPESGAAVPPDQPQFEGVVFDDGTVCQHWLTAGRSHVIWASFADLEKIYGHPEYGTVITWLDG